MSIYPRQLLAGTQTLQWRRGYFGEDTMAALHGAVTRSRKTGPLTPSD